MTEYEINKAVAEKLGVKVYERSAGMLFTATKHRGEYTFTRFDPCNDVQQAWVIMLANNISVTKSRGKYISFYDLRYENPDDDHVAEIETQDENHSWQQCFVSWRT